MVYLKGALDKLGVVADFIHMGAYKSAAEPLTREGPSEDAREAMQELLESLRKTWLDGLDQARGRSDLRRLAERGPWSPNEAKGKKMIDAVGFESDARRDAKKRAQAAEATVAFGPKAPAEQPLDLSGLIRLLSGVDETAGDRPRIAVVPATGGITMGAGSLFEGSGISARALTKTLRRLATDKAVKAVVLRIDSPGGSALASDILWHEIRELDANKPVIASIGSMAASGGYYLACAARRILAESTSLVGSIGVVGGKLVLGSALEKHGIKSVTFAASPDPEAKARAAYLSALTAWDEPTRDRVRSQMRDVYNLFMRRVAAGRKLKKEEVRASAEGRVWSGAQGLKRRLVDELGGLERALVLARRLGGVDARAPIVLEGGVESLLETLLGSGDASVEQAVRALEEHAERRGALAQKLPSRWLSYLESAEPLLYREHVLAALPFAVTVE
jgi:protease-4